MNVENGNGNCNGRKPVPGHPNLRAWPKGVSGNPKGPTKGHVTFAEHIRRIRDTLCSEHVWAIHACEELGLDPDVTKVGALMAEQAIMHGLKGNASYMNEVNERADGKVPQHLDVTAVPIDGFKVEYQRPVIADDPEHPILADGGPAALS